MISNLYCTISADNGDIDNRITAFGYFTPDSSNPYSKLPYPLDEIYGELNDIVENNTKEALREEIVKNYGNVVYEEAE